MICLVLGLCMLRDMRLTVGCMEKIGGGLCFSV